MAASGTSWTWARSWRTTIFFRWAPSGIHANPNTGETNGISQISSQDGKQGRDAHHAGSESNSSGRAQARGQACTRPDNRHRRAEAADGRSRNGPRRPAVHDSRGDICGALRCGRIHRVQGQPRSDLRSEEHTSELQSPCNLVCRLLLEKKKKKERMRYVSTEH